MNPPISEAATEALPESPRLPVFVSADGRRRRVLRLAGRVLAGLTVLWLLALLAGVLGLGRLPGVTLPESAPGHQSHAPAAAPAAGRPSGSHLGKAAAGHRGRSSAHSRSHGTAGTASTGHGRAGGAVRHNGRTYGSSTPAQPSHPSAPAPGRGRPATNQAPAHPSPAPTSRGANPSGGGHPANTTAPAGSGTNPSPSAMEHARRWSGGGG